MIKDNLTVDEIVKLDKLFSFLFLNRRKSYQFDYVRSLLKLEREQYYFLYNIVSEVGKQENLLITDPNCEDMIVDFDTYRCQKFIQSGGFMNYYKIENPTRKQKINLLGRKIFDFEFWRLIIVAFISALFYFMFGIK